MAPATVPVMVPATLEVADIIPPATTGRIAITTGATIIAIGLIMVIPVTAQGTIVRFNSGREIITATISHKIGPCQFDPRTNLKTGPGWVARRISRKTGPWQFARRISQIQVTVPRVELSIRPAKAVTTAVAAANHGQFLTPRSDVFETRSGVSPLGSQRRMS